MPDVSILICGGRNYSQAAVWNWLESTLYAELPPSSRVTKVVHGGASGADKGGANWGLSENAKVICYAANWKRFGKRAGPLRNQRMLDEGKPDFVVAFPGGRGTADMVRRAQTAGVPVIEVQ